MNSNDLKIRKYYKKRLFKYLYIFFSIMIIVLEILALFNVVNMFWGLLIFIILIFLKKYL